MRRISIPLIWCFLFIAQFLAMNVAFSSPAVAIHPGEELVAVSRGNSINVIHLKSEDVLRRFTIDNGEATEVFFMHGGENVIAAVTIGDLKNGNSQSEVRIWELKSGKLVKTFATQRSAITAMARSADGEFLVTGNANHEIKIWDLATYREVRTLAGHTDAIVSLAISRDHKQIASASKDQTTRLWDLESGQLVRMFADAGAVTSVSFNNDGTKLATAGADSRIRIWSVDPSNRSTTSKPIATKFAHAHPIIAMKWSPDGGKIATVSEDQTLKIWDAESLSDPVISEPETKRFASLKWSGNSEHLAAAFVEGEFKVFRAGNGREFDGRLIKAELDAMSQYNVQRGVASTVRVDGKHMYGVSGVHAGSEHVDVKIDRDNEITNKSRWFVFKPSITAPRGEYELTLTTRGRNSINRLNFYVDDYPTTKIDVPNTDSFQSAFQIQLPHVVQGSFNDSKDVDYFAFDGKAKQLIIFDVAHRSMGGGGTLKLKLLGPGNAIIPVHEEHLADGDPLYVVTLPADGKYFASVGVGGSVVGERSNYRIAVGELPFVTGITPNSAIEHSRSQFELVGYNLPADRKLTISTGAAGDLAVPLDPDRFRSREALMLKVNAKQSLASRDASQNSKSIVNGSQPSESKLRYVADEKPASEEQPKKATRILFLTYSGGYKHSSVTRNDKKKELSPAELTMTELAGKSNLFRVDCTQDTKDLNKERLQNYDIVMFYTSGTREQFQVSDADMDYFLNTWIKLKGHGFLGVHAATDTMKEYKPYYEMLGGTFDHHPWNSNANVTVTVHDKEHPISKPWGDEFSINDEIYLHKNFNPDNVRVLMSLNMEKTKLKKPVHVPIAWCKEYGEGKVLHINLGHNESVWLNPKFHESILGGIKWITNAEKGSATPNPELSKAEGEKAKAAFEAAGGDEAEKKAGKK